MRFALFACLVALALSCGSAAAQTPVARLVHSSPAPAHPAPSTIIPGSPLAALTGAATAQATNDTDTPTPFGLSVSSAIDKQTARVFGDFTTAVHQSTRLTPVLDWVRGFGRLAGRRTHLLDIFRALALTIVPALAVERLLHFVLARPRAGLATRAARRLPASDIATELPEDEDDEQGLADAEAGETEKRPGLRLSFLAWGWRLLFGLLHLGLRLVPLLAFVLLVQVLISTSLISTPLITTQSAEFAVIGSANAYLLCRLALEFLRFFLAPQTPGLRLVRLSSAHASAVMRWARLPLVTGFAGYTLVSVGELLDLSHSGATVLIRLITLAVHVEIALGIWKSRRIVGNWLVGAPNATGLAARFRQRLGHIWHYPALFYVLALWIA
jgi:small conductance mechanosensitive channel